jgi:NADPH:quinone reductase-like Zn-dependent oxidoreductase
MIYVRTWQLKGFGLDNLEQVEIAQPEPGSHDVLVNFQAASINPRDQQIAMGQFTPNVTFPLIPLSDGAGEVVATGNDVTRLRVGDRVTPLFFPNWISGEALRDERKVSGGLESPGVLREYGVYSEEAVVRAAGHLSATEAACLPCTGLTAWTALVTKSNIQPGDTVLIQGTGGVATAALQFAKALGAKVITLSSSDEKLARAREMGADHCINYVTSPDWGVQAFELAGHGVDAVVEIGGAGTLENSLAAIRHGGHIVIIGYMAGIEMGVTVFPLIIKNANLHGIGTGNRANYEAMMDFVDKHRIRPQISDSYAFNDAPEALGDIVTGAHFGKLVVDFNI